MGVSSVINKRKYPGYMFLLLGQIVKGKRVDIVVFRYLNDRKSLFRTLMNAITEFVIITICKLLGIRVHWIMHNVDKESVVFFKRLNNFRRRIMLRFANKIFVMDSLLVKHAVAAGAKQSKLDWLSFGLLPTSHYSGSKVDLRPVVREFKSKLGQGGKEVKFGICVSSSMTKFHHFLLVNRFISRANDHADDFVTGLLLVGQFPKGSAFDQARLQVEQNPYILHVDQNFIVNFDEIDSEIDFFYRAVNDLSVSYSVFDAAKSGKPLFTHNCGFLPELVGEYHLGFLIPDDEEDLSTWLKDRLATWDSSPGREFLAARTWKNGAMKLATI